MKKYILIIVLFNLKLLSVTFDITLNPLTLTVGTKSASINDKESFLSLINEYPYDFAELLEKTITDETTVDETLLKLNKIYKSSDVAAQSNIRILAALILKSANKFMGPLELSGKARSFGIKGGIAGVNQFIANVEREIAQHKQMQKQRETIAATKIQQAIKGKKSRETLQKLRKEKLTSDLQAAQAKARQEAAATTIQKIARGKKGRQTAQQLRKAMTAAQQLQAAARSKLEQQKIGQQRTAIEKLQATARTKLQQEQLKKQATAATTIKSTAKQTLARQAYAAILDNARKAENFANLKDSVNNFRIYAKALVDRINKAHSGIDQKTINDASNLEAFTNDYNQKIQLSLTSVEELKNTIEDKATQKIITGDQSAELTREIDTIVEQLNQLLPVLQNISTKANNLKIEYLNTYGKNDLINLDSTLSTLSTLNK